MFRPQRPKNNYFAFTLIELLIVVAIIGILAAIAVPNFMSARLRATVAKAYSDIKALSMANEMYSLDNNGYPPESEHNPYERNRASQGLFFLTSPIAYIASIPDDPFPRTAGSIREVGRFVYETGVFAKKGKVIAYMMYTIGPDLAENGLESANPFFGPQYGGRGNTYATSNGLKSNGDIYLYGGDCSITRSLVVDGVLYQGSCPPSFRN